MVEPEHISIVGVGRSGTTLLMSMLNAHSSIAFPPEFHFVRHYLVKDTRLQRGKLIEALGNDPFFARLGLDPMQAIGGPDDDADMIDLSVAYRRILSQYARTKDTTYVGDKDPKNIEHLPVIAQCLPNPYVIHVIRDPRDVYVSRTKADWAKSKSRTAHLLAYRAQFLAGRHGEKLFGDRYIEVFYEQLLEDPENVLADVCTRLGLPFEREMLDHTASARQLIAEDELQWKGSALKPLLKDNAGKWKEAGLDRNLVLAIESACRPVFKYPRYSESVVPSGVVEKIKLLGWDRAIGFLAALYNWRLRSSGQRTVSQLQSRQSM